MVSAWHFVQGPAVSRVPDSRSLLRWRALICRPSVRSLQHCVHPRAGAPSLTHSAASSRRRSERQPFCTRARVRAPDWEAVAGVNQPSRGGAEAGLRGLPAGGVRARPRRSGGVPMLHTGRDVLKHPRLRSPVSPLPYLHGYCMARVTAAVLSRNGCSCWWHAPHDVLPPAVRHAQDGSARWQWSIIAPTTCKDDDVLRTLLRILGVSTSTSTTPRHAECGAPPCAALLAVVAVS
jgi:hypothetical protein